jgi:hypothetical protein
MKDPKFKEIATAGDLRLVYRQYHGNEYGFTVARNNCILWNGQTEKEGRQMLEKLSSMKW